VIARRSFILGGASILVGSTISSSCGSRDDLAVVQRFPQVLVTGEIRMPVSLATSDGLLVDNAPDVLVARLLTSDRGDVVVDDLVAQRHGAGLSAPYWPFRATIDEPGTYVLQIEGGSDGAAVQVLSVSDAVVPGAGDPMPPFDTPTRSDPRGVNPICTRTPEACPLHDITLTEALSLGRSIAYLVGTPAFCSTGTCSPALESLLAVCQRVGDALVGVHADIYTDRTATTVAPAVRALGMTFEPALFLVDATGTIVERLDAVFDETEINERLSALGLIT